MNQESYPPFDIGQSAAPTVKKELPQLEIPCLLDLSALLQESLTLKSERDQEKEIRKKIQRGGMPANELEESQALLRRWNNEREWTRSKNILVFTRQRCRSCGAFHKTVEGFFEMYINNRLPGTTKLTTVKVFELPNLERDTVYHDSEVEICHLCADGAGWPLEEE